MTSLVDLVDQHGHLLCQVTKHLTDAELAVAIPILSKNEMMIDQPWPLRTLIDGLGRTHLPRHADQVAALAI